MKDLKQFRDKLYLTLTNAIRSKDNAKKLICNDSETFNSGKFTANTLSGACKVCTDSKRSKNQKAVPPPKVPVLKSVLWRNLTCFVAFPSIVVIAGTVLISIMTSGHKEKPPYADYEYMYRRIKRFPWGDGDKTFFHNPQANNLPSDKPQPKNEDDED